MNALYHDRQAGRIPPFDNVVIETSGLAEPGPILQAFLSEPTLDGLYTVAGVVAIVDAVYGPGTWDEHEEAVRQVALADTVLISKLDLADGEGREAMLRAEVARMNPSATVLRTDDPSLSVAELLTHAGFDPATPGADPRAWLKADAFADRTDHDHTRCDDPDHDQAPGGDHHRGHDHDHEFRDRGIETFVLIRDEPLTREAVQFLLDGISQNLGANLLRVKGLVNVAEEPGRPAVILGVQHLLHTMSWLDRWPDEDNRTRIVFITQGVMRETLAEVIELLDRIAERTSRARLKAQQGTST